MNSRLRQPVGSRANLGGSVVRLVQVTVNGIAQNDSTRCDRDAPAAAVDLCRIWHINFPGMDEGDKPLVWLHGEIKTPPLSAKARLQAGHLLRRLQRGEVLSMPDSRAMPSIGPSAMKKTRLEAKGWKVGSAEEFLGLTPDEAAYVEIRLKLSDALREYRKRKRLTQVQLAELLQSSQSRVAKAEAADESVSLDLLIRSLLALGASHQDLAKVITGGTRTPPAGPRRSGPTRSGAIRSA
jgi:predicted XRE-type DNA-binding protein